MSELNCERKLSEEKSELSSEIRGSGTMKVSLKTSVLENTKSVSRSPKFVVANGLFILDCELIEILVE
jgi:hypothetical protein